MGYNNLVNKNFDSTKNSTGFDMNSIEEKMKQFKFAKVENSGAKDANWFQKLNQREASNESMGAKRLSIKTNNVGLTEEDERRINKEMIPKFIAKQQELKPEYEHIKNVGKELEQLKQEFGVVIKQAPSQATTSFMNRKGSQARDYEKITNKIRENRKTFNPSYVPKTAEMVRSMSRGRQS